MIANLFQLETKFPSFISIGAKLTYLLQVALHLFQAGANQVKLGIQKPAHLPPPPPSNQIIGVI